MKQLFWILIVLFLASCKNRSITESEEMRPRVLADEFEDSYFKKLVVDGVEYIMMERDNNNPHEGFGFMAFRANRLLEKQDTLLAYLMALQVYQNRIYARVSNISEQDAMRQFNQTFEEFLSTEREELIRLEKEELINENNP